VEVTLVKNTKMLKVKHLRDDDNFKFVGAWEYKGSDINQAQLHKEELKYEFIKIAARNYK
jgi:succinate dehydrogenase / fumarate reductase, flavoprotein subunit